MKKYLFLLIAILFPLLVVFVYLKFYSVDGSTYTGGICTFYDLTGLDCPGCGGQRTFYYLLHGDIVSALRHNAFFVLIVPFLLYLYYACIQVYILKKEKYLDTWVFKPRVLFCVLAILITFFIIRNIPFDPFTYLNSHY